MQTNNKNIVSPTDKIFEITKEKFNEISKTLNKEINNKYYQFSVQESCERNKYLFRKQIYKIANNYEYYANLETYNKWIRLKLKNTRNCSIVFSLHSVSKTFSSIMSTIMFLEYRGETEGHIFINGPYSLSKNPYIFTTNDNEEKIISSFKEWLHNNLMNGLIMWQQNI